MEKHGLHKDVFTSIRHEENCQNSIILQTKKNTPKIIFVGYKYIKNNLCLKV